jgi:hypothetical protein
LTIVYRLMTCFLKRQALSIESLPYKVFKRRILLVKSRIQLVDVHIEALKELLCLRQH